MRILLNSIDDAVDRKYLVAKTIKGQVEAGTVIHIMGAQQEPNGITVNYRVTSTGEDHSAKFSDLKEFCKWASADNFVARYQENLTTKDIRDYIKVRDTSFLATGGIPVIISILIVWGIVLVGILFDTELLAIWQLILGGVCLSVMVYFIITTLYKRRRTKVMTQIYNKVSANWEGGGVVLR